MRKFRRLFLTLGIAPVLMGAALAAGATLASPDGASASGCSELSGAALYHGSRGNYDYGSWLLQLAIDMGCF